MRQLIFKSGMQLSDPFRINLKLKFDFIGVVGVNIIKNQL